MTSECIDVLLIEDNQMYATLVAELISGSAARTARFAPLRLTHARSLAEGLNKLAAPQSFGLIVLDLTLPDSDGLDTFRRVSEHAADTPIIVLTALADEGLALAAMQAGAQDYLFKGDENQHPLLHAMRFAIERYRLLRELRNLALIDPLTGLYNRRGFFALAEQQLRLASRNRQKVMLLYADLDGLKEINDTGGHVAGDQALRDTAAALRHTFRDSDILGRLGGDEFAVLAIGASDKTAQFLASRLQATVAAARVQAARPYILALSLGVAHYDWQNPVSVDTLLAQADHAMYQLKRQK